MKAYTDYPLEGIDEPNHPAPVREVVPIGYDGDKLVEVEFEGQKFKFKAGYLYTLPGRYGDVPRFDVNTLPAIPHWTDDLF